MIDVSDYLLWFFIYSFLGWVWETTYCSILEGRFINRGFLNGPIIPIYGCGAVLVMLAAEIGGMVFPADMPALNIPTVFFGGMILCTVLEYITAVILETLFHIRWWDYSTERFNFQGRICLKSALFFGLLSVLIVTVIHPLISGATDGIPNLVKYALILGFAAGILVDIGITLVSLLHVNERLEELQKMLEEARDTAVENVKEAVEKQRYQVRRLAKAFPTSKSLMHGEAWEMVKRRLIKKRE
ncbi:MAG: hypothetical protein Q4Q04_03560 [Methanocorpusculum sp.]|nr:hypothetical protein [Methanocorpusculum sp.]